VRRVTAGTRDRREEQRATTDADGRFTFPEVAERSLLMRILPGEAVITIGVFAVTAAGETKLLSVVKRNFDRNGEFGGSARAWEFDLAAPESGLEFGTGALSPPLTARLSTQGRTALAGFVRDQAGGGQTQRNEAIDRMFDQALEKAKRQ